MPIDLNARMSALDMKLSYLAKQIQCIRDNGFKHCFGDPPEASFKDGLLTLNIDGYTLNIPIDGVSYDSKADLGQRHFLAGILTINGMEYPVYTNVPDFKVEDRGETGVAVFYDGNSIVYKTERPEQGLEGREIATITVNGQDKKLQETVTTMYYDAAAESIVYVNENGERIVLGTGLTIEERDAHAKDEKTRTIHHLTINGKPVEIKETVTSVSFDGKTDSLVFVDETGASTKVLLKDELQGANRVVDGHEITTLTFTRNRDGGAKSTDTVTISETVTSLDWDNRDYILTYKDEAGVVKKYDLPNLLLAGNVENRLINAPDRHNIAHVRLEDGAKVVLDGDIDETVTRVEKENPNARFGDYVYTDEGGKEHKIERGYLASGIESVTWGPGYKVNNAGETEFADNDDTNKEARGTHVIGSFKVTGFGNAPFDAVLREAVTKLYVIEPEPGKTDWKIRYIDEGGFTHDIPYVDPETIKKVQDIEGGAWIDDKMDGGPYIVWKEGDDVKRLSLQSKLNLNDVTNFDRFLVNDLDGDIDGDKVGSVNGSVASRKLTSWFMPHSSYNASTDIAEWVMVSNNPRLPIPEDTTRTEDKRSVDFKPIKGLPVMSTNIKFRDDVQVTQTDKAWLVPFVEPAKNGIGKLTTIRDAHKLLDMRDGLVTTQEVTAGELDAIKNNPKLYASIWWNLQFFGPDTAGTNVDTFAWRRISLRDLRFLLGIDTNNPRIQVVADPLTITPRNTTLTYEEAPYTTLSFEVNKYVDSWDIGGLFDSRAPLGSPTGNMYRYVIAKDNPSAGKSYSITVKAGNESATATVIVLAKKEVPPVRPPAIDTHECVQNGSCADPRIAHTVDCSCQICGELCGGGLHRPGAGIMSVLPVRTLIQRGLTEDTARALYNNREFVADGFPVETEANEETLKAYMIERGVYDLKVELPTRPFKPFDDEVLLSAMSEDKEDGMMLADHPKPDKREFVLANQDSLLTEAEVDALIENWDAVADGEKAVPAVEREETTLIMRIPVEPEPPKSYSIDIRLMGEGGFITATPSENVNAGQTVTLNIAVVEGYQLKEGSLEYMEVSPDSPGDFVPGTGTPIVGYSFLMPLCDVIVTAVFEKIPSVELPPDWIEVACGDTTVKGVSGLPGASITIPFGGGFLVKGEGSIKKGKAIALVVGSATAKTRQVLKFKTGDGVLPFDSQTATWHDVFDWDKRVFRDYVALAEDVNGGGDYQWDVNSSAACQLSYENPESSWMGSLYSRKNSIVSGYGNTLEVPMSFFGRWFGPYDAYGNDVVRYPQTAHMYFVSTEDLGDLIVYVDFQSPTYGKPQKTIRAPKLVERLWQPYGEDDITHAACKPFIDNIAGRYAYRVFVQSAMFDDDGETILYLLNGSKVRLVKEGGDGNTTVATFDICPKGIWYQ